MTAKQSFKCNPTKALWYFLSHSALDNAYFPTAAPKSSKEHHGITGHSVSLLLSGIVCKNGENQENCNIWLGGPRSGDESGSNTLGGNVGDKAPFHITAQAPGELKDGEFPGGAEGRGILPLGSSSPTPAGLGLAPALFTHTLFPLTPLCGSGLPHRQPPSPGCPRVQRPRSGKKREEGGGSGGRSLLTAAAPLRGQARRRPAAPALTPATARPAHQAAAARVRHILTAGRGPEEPHAPRPLAGAPPPGLEPRAARARAGGAAAAAG